MKNKIIPIIVVFISLVVVITFLIIDGISSSIPNDYIAVFQGESVNTKYSTYIYKIDNGHANMGFKYINTITIKGKTNIKDKGEFSWTDGAFIVAKKHGAYDYVEIPGDTKRYTIEEFQGRFIMN